jgi:hypothetical protein
MSGSISSTCKGCGCANFASPPGCKACGYGIKREDEPTVRVPSARDYEERSRQIRAIIEYAVSSRDVAGAARALDSAMLTPGSELAKLLGAA